MHWLSILYFFVVTLLAGTLIDCFVRDWAAGWLEKIVMRFGVGLAALSVFGVVLNLLRIPLDYRVFLGAGILVFLAALAVNRRSLAVGGGKGISALAHCWKNRSFWYGLCVLVLFAVTVDMYVGGSFSYDYFEDTDPWGYAAVADYIAEHKTFSVPYYSVQYSEPYTQGYQIVMGVLAQTNDSIYWTMKFFNALIISFGVPFVYYFARRFSGSEELALLASLFLFAVPAWLSHFVFSLNFNMTIFVVLLYVLAQLCRDHRPAATGAGDPPVAPSLLRGWLPVGMVVYASMLVNHFSTALHASIFCAVLVATKTLAEKRIDWHTVLVFPGGLALALLFYVPAYAKHWQLTGSSQELGGISVVFPVVRFLATPLGLLALAAGLALAIFLYRRRRRWQPALEAWLAAGHRGLCVWLAGVALVVAVLLLPFEISHSLGTGDFNYALIHFYAARADNMMNNPVGLGWLLLAAVALAWLLASVRLASLFRPENAWVAVGYAWVITAFLLVLGKYFSIAILPFRVWPFLGLFASLFAAWGITAGIRSVTRNDWVLPGAIALLAACLVPTSFLPKRELNTKVWEDHTVGTPESRALYAWMRGGGIPANSVVARLCGSSEFLSGYDMNPPLWNEAFQPARESGQPYFAAHPLSLTPEAYLVLKGAGVDYVTFGFSCYMGESAESQERIDELMHRLMLSARSDPRLVPLKSTGAEFLFKLR